MTPRDPAQGILASIPLSMSLPELLQALLDGHFLVDEQRAVVERHIAALRAQEAT